MKIQVIVFHGWEDPFAPSEDLVALGGELSGSDGDRQTHVYSRTVHPPMARGANNAKGHFEYLCSRSTSSGSQERQLPMVVFMAWGFAQMS
jgi:hypothetical protein